MSTSGLATEAVKQLQQSRNQPPGNGWRCKQRGRHRERTLRSLDVHSCRGHGVVPCGFLGPSGHPKDCERRASLGVPRFCLSHLTRVLLAGVLRETREQQSPLPTAREFPWFRLISSIIAFSVWGLCVPVPGIRQAGFGSPLRSPCHVRVDGAALNRGDLQLDSRNAKAIRKRGRGLTSFTS